jgi:RecA/RadA recombinase
MAKKAAKLSDKALRELMADIKSTTSVTRSNIQFLNTGSTLVNIGLSGRWDGGWPLGGYNLIAGGSGSGKTLLTLATLAEAANDPRFDEYELIYDGPEGGALFDMAKMYGSKLVARMAAPCRGISYKIEEFYANLRAHAATERPFVWVLDSMDSLSSDQEQGVNEENDRRVLVGDDLQGSYGDGKARTNSQNIRTIMEFLVRSNSLLIIICQTRDSLGGTFSESVYSGGRALRFYADCRMWTADVGQIKKTVKGHDVTMGNHMKVKVDKNRVRGRKFDVEIPLYNHIGVDDIGSLVDYLVEYKRWAATAGNITAKDLNVEGMPRDHFIQYLESCDYGDEVRLIAQEHWLEMEAAAAATVVRKPRYE